MSSGLRITGGHLSGRRIPTSQNAVLRPTPDRVRKSVFEIAKSYLVESVFLDLFAGSGINGLEAISRGAKRVVFIDKNRKLCSNLIENLSTLNVSNICQVICKDVMVAISDPEIWKTANCIFMDPPYESGLIVKTLKKIDSVLCAGQLKLVITEFYRKELICCEELNHLRCFRREQYGDTVIGFWQVKSEE